METYEQINAIFEAHKKSDNKAFMAAMKDYGPASFAAEVDISFDTDANMFTGFEILRKYIILNEGDKATINTKSYKNYGVSPVAELIQLMDEVNSIIAQHKTSK